MTSTGCADQEAIRAGLPVPLEAKAQSTASFLPSSRPPASLWPLGTLPMRPRITNLKHPVELTPILSFSEAEAILRGRRLTPQQRFVIRIPDIPVEVCIRWERQVNTALSECGCVLGARFGFAALCTTGLVDFFEIPAMTWQRVLCQIVLVVPIASILGKAVAIYRVRVRILRVVRQMKEYALTFNSAEARPESFNPVTG